MPNARKPPLPALTGLRFFAAAWVVAYHLRPTDAIDGGWIERFAGAGYVGVSLFFVLSGFILAYTYMSADAAPKIDYWAFVRARFARVYPVYGAALLIAAPFFLLNGMRGDTPLFQAAVLAPALLQAWVPKAACAWNCPGWSLSAEALFYAAFPLLAVWVSRRPTRLLPWLALAAWGAALLAPAAYLLSDPDGIGAGGPHAGAFWITATKYLPLFRLPEFALGVLAGQWYLRRAPALGRWGAPAVAAVVGAVSAPVAIPYILLHNGLLAPVFALLILALADRCGALSRALATPAVVRLGEASYALYLVHVPVLSAVPAVALRVGVPPSSPAAKLVGAFASLALAFALYHGVEEPMRKRLRGSPPRSPRAPISPQATSGTERPRSAPPRREMQGRR